MKKKPDQWRGSNFWLGLVILLLLAGCGSQSGLSDQTSSSGSSSSGSSQNSGGIVPKVVYNGKVDPNASTTVSTSVADIAAPVPPAVTAKANAVSSQAAVTSQVINTGVVQVANIGQSTIADPPYQGTFTVANTGQVSFYVEPYPSHCGPCTFQVSVDGQVIINSPALLPASQGNTSYATMSSVATIPLTAGAHSIKVVCAKADCDPATCCGCCIPGPWARGGSWGALVTYQDAAALKTVTIQNFAAKPSTINPNANQSTSLEADIVQTGFTNPQMTWTMTPGTISPPALAISAKAAAAAIDPGGGGLGLPPVFSGSGDLNSGLAHIAQSWNGKSDTGQNVAFGTYPYTLNVTVVDGSGESQSASANTTVAISGDPVLEVLDASSTTLASSEDQVASPTPAGVKRLLNVFPFKRPNQNNTLTVRASSLAFKDNADPPNVTVTLTSSNSQQPALNVPLNRISAGNYENTNVVLDKVVVLDPKFTATSHNYTDAAAGTRSSTTPVGRDFFLKLLDKAKSIYPTTSKSDLGHFLVSYPNKAYPGLAAPPSDVALATPENVRSFGFEAVNVTIDSNPNQNPKLNLTQPLQALLKVRHSANLAIVFAHGDHTGNVGVTNGDLDPGPTNLGGTFLPADTAELKTLILPACNALDMHDYNNNYPGAADAFNGQVFDGNRVSATDPINKRNSPGQKWWTLTHQTGAKADTVLLGYNFPVPFVTAKRALDKYDALLPQLKGTVRPEIAAWLTAHAQDAVALPSALAACAWDKDGYYFISFRPRIVPFGITDLDKENRKIMGYFKVKLDGTGENTVTTFTSPPTLGNVTRLNELPIPPSFQP